MTCPHLAAYKLQHAMTLAEYGYRDKALQYCEAIAYAITSQTKRSPYHHSVLEAAVDDLMKRLKQAPREESNSWIPKPSMNKVSDTVWNRFNKFVAGDDNDGSGPGSEADGGAELGPFAHATGTTPTISRPPSASARPAWPCLAAKFTRPRGIRWRTVLWPPISASRRSQQPEPGHDTRRNGAKCRSKSVRSQLVVYAAGRSSYGADIRRIQPHVSRAPAAILGPVVVRIQSELHAPHRGYVVSQLHVQQRCRTSSQLPWSRGKHPVAAVLHAEPAIGIRGLRHNHQRQVISHHDQPNSSMNGSPYAPLPPTQEIKQDNYQAPSYGYQPPSMNAPYEAPSPDEPQAPKAAPSGGGYEPPSFQPYGYEPPSHDPDPEAPNEDDEVPRPRRRASWMMTLTTAFPSRNPLRRLRQRRTGENEEMFRKAAEEDGTCLDMEQPLSVRSVPTNRGK